MNGDISICVEERGRRKATEAVEAGEDLIKNDGKACPCVGITGSFFNGGTRFAEEIWGFADDVDESALEERISVNRELVRGEWSMIKGNSYTNAMPPAPRTTGSMITEPKRRPCLTSRSNDSLRNASYRTW